jgi:hypothetical protein
MILVPGSLSVQRGKEKAQFPNLHADFTLRGARVPCILPD